MAVLLASAGEGRSQTSGGAICSVSATGLNFGPYISSVAAPTDITGTVAVTCSAPGFAAVPVAFSIALLGHATEGGRRAVSGHSSLRYRLYLDAARVVAWGDGSAGTRTINGDGIVSGSAPLRQTFTVYGRLLARQADVQAGQHVDAVPVLLTYH
jgi:spore coat protein U-like protein